VSRRFFIGFAPVENPRIAVAVMIEGISEADEHHGGTRRPRCLRSLEEGPTEENPIGVGLVATQRK